MADTASPENAPSKVVWTHYGLNLYRSCVIRPLSTNFYLKIPEWSRRPSLRWSFMQLWCQWRASNAEMAHWTNISAKRSVISAIVPVKWQKQLHLAAVHKAAIFFLRVQQWPVLVSKHWEVYCLSWEKKALQIRKYKTHFGDSLALHEH